MMILVNPRFCRISYQPARRHHCGHGKANPGVWINTGGSPHLFLGYSRRVGAGWSEILSGAGAPANGEAHFV